MELGIDPYEELDIVDYGDVDARPSDLAWSHAALRQGVADILGAGAIPVVLGGDHSLSTPVLEALAAHHGSDGFSVVHFDTHADTGSDEREAPARRPVPPGGSSPAISTGTNIVQIGLRGAWPFPEEFQWMREAGFRWHTDRRDRRARHRAGRARRDRARPRPRAADVPHGRRRRARPGVRPRHRHGRARRAHDARAPVGGAHGRLRARPVLDGRRRGLAALRPGRHHRDGGAAGRARDALGHRVSDGRGARPGPSAPRIRRESPTEEPRP